MNERQNMIYEIITTRGSASIGDLTGEVFASTATIRRDLQAMAQAGLLKRTWGGAVSVNHSSIDPPAFLRSNTNLRAKKKIAAAAAELCYDGASIFLPSGTTVTELAKLLHRWHDISVFTNGVETAAALNHHRTAKIVLLGGTLYEGYDTIGSLTEDAIQQFHADLFFFSCSGITADGFTAAVQHRLDIMRRMMQNSSKTILMIDASKAGQQFTYKGFALENIDHIIMEEPPQDVALLETIRSKLIIAE